MRPVDAYALKNDLEFRYYLKTYRNWTNIFINFHYRGLRSDVSELLDLIDNELEKKKIKISFIMHAGFFSVLDFAAVVLMLVFALTANQLDWFTNYSGFAMIPLMAFYFLGKWTQKKQQEKQNT